MNAAGEIESADNEGGICNFRRQYRAGFVPSIYRGWRHFAQINGMIAIAVTLCAMRLRAIHVWEWWVVPATALYANLAEYLGHRFVMHRLRPGFGLIYRRHVKQHHRFFTHTAMAVDSPRDFKAVLFPPILVGLFLGGFGAPVAWLVGVLFSANAAWLFAITGLLYFLNYEYLHLAYHLPESSWVVRIPGFTRLRSLHRTHHNPGVMATCNFNITYPIGDWLFRTLR